MTEFTIIGYEAESGDWELKVRNGFVQLSGEFGAYVTNMNATEARERGKLLIAAADLLDGTPQPSIEQPRELTVNELDALPVGSIVRDCDDEKWQRVPNGWRHEHSTDGIDTSQWLAKYAPITLVSTP